MKACLKTLKSLIRFQAMRYQRPEQFALCEHVMQLDHSIGWNDFLILKFETNYSQRLTAKA